MEVKGTIRFIGEMISVTTAFQKRELVVTTDEQYPQHISINFTQDKCDLLNNYNVSDQVNVSINLRGREWVNPQGETRYFNDIQGWRIASVQPAHTSTPASTGNAQTMPNNQSPATTQQTAFNEDEPDDLPF